ncbi:hypothetical protein pben1_p43 [Paracoccus phage vB_PbeS_Pben1]|uniref:DUF3168 domain-containing protein n=1 Tax=Paracoccus versutus TaxID=34007 RepID=A0A3D9XVS0_PARVE|nr:hypothetical protein [Paracoccus versutus]AZV00200.1 hypothetical protein pben1_p43 [Paracoccus phage vB_PbeS_Pben1]REF72312.1 hypothetical protein BDD41_0781 [Paracoccus versutus]WGR55707.1 hypothetical protein E3U25_06945 [Paracoccus versutus]
MPHYRSSYRASVLAALIANARFSGFTALKVWPGSVDADSLPVIGVLTPQDRCERDTQKTTVRRTLLQVAVRRLGGDDVEDVLDDDSEVIEAIVLATLRRLDQPCALEDTSVVSSTVAERNVGTLVMSFRLQSWRPVATLP